MTKETRTVSEPETVIETETKKLKAPLIPRFKLSPEVEADSVKLATMLTYCRPAFTRAETRFIKDYIKPVGVKYDRFGNAFKRVGDAPILWSSHTDTVHNAPGKQAIEYWVNSTSGDTFYGTATGTKSGCLGADDTAGIWLMLEMIKHNVPGLYVFHRSEEKGGLGSKWIVNHNPDFLKGIKFAIAFDRKEEGSIITHQRGSRCCSSEFSKSLAEGLAMGHKDDSGGSFTDTASYTDLIGECTNVSVGYRNAHWDSENLNIDYLFELRDAICKMDLSKLEEKRKPGEKTYYGSYNYCGAYGGGHHDSDFQSGWGKDWAIVPHNGEPVYLGGKYPQLKYGGLYSYTFLRELLEENIPDWLANWAYDYKTQMWTARDSYIYVKTLSPAQNLGVTKLSPEAHKAQKEGSKNGEVPTWEIKKEAEQNAAALAKIKASRVAEEIETADERTRGTFQEMIRLIRENPEIIADLLEGQGYGPLEIREYILKSCGILT